MSCKKNACRFYYWLPFIFLFTLLFYFLTAYDFASGWPKTKGTNAKARKSEAHYPNNSHETASAAFLFYFIYLFTLHSYSHFHWKPAITLVPVYTWRDIIGSRWYTIDLRCREACNSKVVLPTQNGVHPAWVPFVPNSAFEKKSSFLSSDSIILLHRFIPPTTSSRSRSLSLNSSSTVFWFMIHPKKAYKNKQTTSLSRLFSIVDILSLFKFSLEIHWNHSQRRKNDIDYLSRFQDFHRWISFWFILFARVRDVSGTTPFWSQCGAATAWFRHRCRHRSRLGEGCAPPRARPSATS